MTNTSFTSTVAEGEPRSAVSKYFGGSRQKNKGGDSACSNSCGGGKGGGSGSDSTRRGGGDGRSSGGGSGDGSSVSSSIPNELKDRLEDVGLDDFQHELPQRIEVKYS